MPLEPINVQSSYVYAAEPLPDCPAELKHLHARFDSQQHELQKIRVSRLQG